MGKRAGLKLDIPRRPERMVQRRHPVEEALDFARMPALARTSVAPPIPPNIVEVMRIAAGAPAACQEASEATGESSEVLIEAARFYLQQILFRPDADSRRILGLQPDATRDTARDHMRWLLQWVHPDRNDGLEAVYAERVVKAWRELSAPNEARSGPSRGKRRARGPARPAPFRLPWIENPSAATYRGQGAYLTAVVWVMSAFLVGLVALGSAVYFFGFIPVAVVAAP